MALISQRCVYRIATLLHPNAVVISLPVYRRTVCLLPYCGFKVIDQSGSCKFAGNGFISCADDSKACADVLLTVAQPTFSKRFHCFNNHSDT